MKEERHSQFVKLTKCSKDGIKNKKVLLKKRHLKDKSSYKTIWQKLQNNAQVKITKPTPLTKDPGAPTAFGLVMTHDEEDIDGFMTASEHL